jgi:hypothetical protein
MQTTLFPALLVLLSADPKPDRAGVEFFEQKIRPVLVKECYSCHATTAKKVKANLLLDTRAGTLKGGESGPALVPGKPGESLLLKALRYQGETKMPPSSKLPDAVIADFTKWIEIGAPDPRDAAPAAGTPATWEKVLAERRKWWSLQPVGKHAVPAVRDTAWSEQAIDRFLLARLEAARLKPADDADRRTLIRRLSFVLTGLPAQPEEVEAFVNDRSPDAYRTLVDRLLASPHFGERWAQHWLDVVRFSETHGNEWNYEVQFAYRYRDYLIRAFNEDVPYNQLAREHIAGDLLREPRRNGREGFNESAIGTMFYRFGDGNVEDCIAVPQVAYDVVDNQIDTLGKAFQATTIACARCHDHKLDAVSMKDYYALIGILHSSRQLTHTIDRPDTNAREMAGLREVKAEIRKELAEIWLRDAADVGRYLLAAEARRAKAPNAAELARGLNATRLDRWVATLQATADKQRDLFTPWRTAAAAGKDKFAAEWQKQADLWTKETKENAEFNRQNFREYADFRHSGFGTWQVGGHGLRDASSGVAGELALTHDGDNVVKTVLPAGCYTHMLSEKLNGTLRSPVLPDNAGKHVSVEMMGNHASEVTLVSHNCQVTDSNYFPPGEDRFSWATFNLPEHAPEFRCYVELATRFDNPKFPDPIQKPGKYKDKENYRVAWEQAAANVRSYFGVRRVVFHDGDKPPRPELNHYRPLFEHSAPASVTEAADRYAAAIKAAVQAWTERATDDDVQWVDALVQNGLLSNQLNSTLRLEELVGRYRTIEAQLAIPHVIHGLGDFGPGFEQPLFTRGECTKPGARVPRRYLEVLARPGETFKTSGSGRLELAESIARADNPLTARVMVNRVWQHVFGEGLVRTVDDFGQNGEKPTHPELLDYLATRFVEDGWSVKRLIRALVLTRTFQLSNRPNEAARSADPENRKLHHYAAHRLEAEAIRDVILAASGRLDLTMYGTSIEPYRERQIAFQRLFTGPLDGRGRRSLYIKHTLMEAPKFLNAFNYPKGTTMQGRRDVTNVPAQALALLNDPFVLQQADVWGTRLAAGPQSSVAKRVEHMFRVAFGRAPEASELARYEKMVARLAELHGVTKDDVLRSPAVWKDVAHTLFNAAEFVYIP